MVFGAPDRATLIERLGTLLARLDGVDNLRLRDLAASLAARWRLQPERLTIVARHADDLRAKLLAAQAFLRGESKSAGPGVAHGSTSAHAGKVAVLFSGQGSQYPDMAREAALHFDAVADALAGADAVLREAFDERFGSGRPLSSFIFPRGAYSADDKAAARQALTSTDVAQPALGAVEVGLYRLMHSLGLRPDMLGGHSYGELVALHAAGAIDFDALMQLSAARGRFIVDAAGAAGAELGTMAAATAPRSIVEDAIADIAGVTIANHNAPAQCIVSGTRAGVQAACAKLSGVGIEATEIPVAAAFHSTLVKPAQEALSRLIETTAWAPTRLPVYSNSTARPHVADVARVKRQMAEHLVQPVEFVAEIEAMYGDGARVFVEVGPKAVLARLTGRILEGRPHVAVAIDDGTGLPGLLGGLGQLLCAGVALDLDALYARRSCRVGDPEQPASLAAVAAISKHAWMLNGSGARRAVDPVRQVGVTLEQAQAQSQARTRAGDPTPRTAEAPDAVAEPAAPPAVQRAAATSSINLQPIRRGDRSMDERRTAPGMADSSVMSEYFLTMRQFLETQERVMSAFLGESTPSRAPALRTRPMPMALPRLAEAVPGQPSVAAAPIAAVAPAPAAPAVPVPATPVAKAPPPAAPVKPSAPVPAASSDAAGGPLTREGLVDLVLGIVEEKTGYPRDMVGLDQNLEADLGIDSIKRIEVVGAMLQALPPGYRDALSENRSKLNTQATLNGLLDLVTQAKVGGAVAVPFDSAGAGSRAENLSHPPRLVMRPRQEPIPERASRRLTPGRFILTRDALGVAAALADVLRARGASDVALIDAEVLESESGLLQRCQALQEGGAVAGFVHLATLGSAELAATGTPAQWRVALQRNEKSFFLLLRQLSGLLAEEAHVVAVSGLGGLFGREGSSSAALRLESGALGTVKSLREERPRWRVRAVDVDPSRAPADVAADLLAEIELVGGRQEVGYPRGRRTIFVTTPEFVVIDPARDASLRDLVVVATGGARGITAEVMRELARPGNTLVLTGRRRLDEVESADTAALSGADALRSHFVARVRSGVAKMTPGEIGRVVQGLLDQREMRANLQDLRAGGAVVEYHAVDVTDADTCAALMDDVVRRLGRIDGIVHGAGIIEDKLLADKTSESWSRVVETKVLGLLNLQRCVDPGTLRFFTVFSSVAGRYGNSGQSDYATANELMNRLCMALQARWGDATTVSALCWGPWGATKFGAGMVTAETEAKFAQKGVTLVSAALGRRLFREELARTAGLPVEVVCGAAPWARLEAEAGVIAMQPAPRALGALLGHADIETCPTGERVFRLPIDPAQHRYLHEHALDGKPVLPAAAALELMAEAAAVLWPGWHVASVSEHKLLKGLEFVDAPREIRIVVSPPPYGSSEGFEVGVTLQSEIAEGRALTHYRCVVALAHALPPADPAPRERHDEQQLTVDKAYREWLFHGPRLQVIEGIDGLSRSGSGATVRSTSPATWLAELRDDAPGWVFDPGLLDAAAQMAWLWARAFRDESALPTRFGRVVRYRDRCPPRMHMEYARIEVTDPTLIRANVVFCDDAGDAVLSIEELDSVASAALNRLGGTARSAESALT